ncbi:MAG: LacI family DNA-binding transcriptional regulator [Anaerolineae bacterium]
MGVSIKEIARAAGVSHSTVSRALRHSPLISEETAARIQRLAAEMGYVPSAIARGLVTQSSRTVGLVVTTIADPFIAEIVRGVEEVALDHGYSVFLCNSNAQPQREVAAVRILRENRVDGVIVTSSRVGDLYLPLLEEMKVPIVLINNQRAGRYVWSVATDNIHGGCLAMEYLIELGHRRIGYIGGSPEVNSNRHRWQGYRQALRAHRIRYEPQLVTSGNGRMEGGQVGVQKLLCLAEPPTAIFCYNDMTAIGALRALKEARLQVPQDMSVIGFDDIALAAYVEPPLTTIAQPKHEMGQLAMRMLLELLSGKKEVHNILLQGELIVRASCAPFRKHI